MKGFKGKSDLGGGSSVAGVWGTSHLECLETLPISSYVLGR